VGCYRPNHIIITERRIRAVNAPALYLEGPGFQSQPGDQLMTVFIILLELFMQVHLKLGQLRLVPYLCYVFVHNHVLSYSTLYRAFEKSLCSTHN